MHFYLPIFLGVLFRCNLSKVLKPHTYMKFHFILELLVAFIISKHILAIYALL